MEISKQLESAFNDQITLEFQSAYSYLGMAAWFESAELPGFSHWMRAQAEEEWGHALRFYEHVLDRDGAVRLGPLDPPRDDFSSPLEVFETAMTHEQAVSLAINALYGQAVDERDFASVPLLDWFVNEQIEEEATVRQIIEDLRRTEGDAQALLMLDRELGARETAGS